VIAINTNVLVRYLVQDDRAQSAIATNLLENELTPEVPGFISLFAILKFNWVLRTQYGFSPQIVTDTIGALMCSPNLVFENAGAVGAALAFQHGDLADNILHEIGLVHGCTKTVTFDKKFARLAGIELLK
jgi:predicted nucleic-acid-binding protein